MIGIGTAVCILALALMVAVTTLGATASVVQGFRHRPKHRRSPTAPAHLVPVGRWDQ